VAAVVDPNDEDLESLAQDRAHLLDAGPLTAEK
jgi:hypothetical protein